MNKRSTLIVVLLLGIAAFALAAVLKGEGNFLLALIVAVGFYAFFGLVLMMRWTLSMQVWGGIGDWLRNRRR